MSDTPCDICDLKNGLDWEAQEKYMNDATARANKGRRCREHAEYCSCGNNFDWTELETHRYFNRGKPQFTPLRKKCPDCVARKGKNGNNNNNNKKEPSRKEGEGSTRLRSLSAGSDDTDQQKTQALKTLLKGQSGEANGAKSPNRITKLRDALAHDNSAFSPGRTVTTTATVSEEQPTRSSFAVALKQLASNKLAAQEGASAGDNNSNDQSEKQQSEKQHNKKAYNKEDRVFSPGQIELYERRKGMPISNPTPRSGPLPVFCGGGRLCGHAVPYELGAWSFPSHCTKEKTREGHATNWKDTVCVHGHCTISFQELAYALSHHCCPHCKVHFHTGVVSGFGLVLH